MSNYIASSTDLTSVANAIRTAGGTSAQLEFPSGFVTAIGNISGGGGGGGLTNIVTGTFEPTVAEEGTVKTISTGYTGSGYPIAAFVFPSVGAYKSGSDIYTTVHMRGVVMLALAKADMSTSPLFDTQNIERNWASAVAEYKDSSSDASVLSAAYGKTLPAMTSYNANGDYAVQALRFTGKTNMTVYISDASKYGFISGIEYTYYVIYSE